MKYFKLSDLEVTNTGISNKMDKEDIKDAEWFINNVLDPIREEYGKPLYINSGYRSKLVNIKVKGAKTSDHLSIGKVFAVDITTRTGDNKKVFDIIQKMQKSGKITFKQLINEYSYKWIHISSYTLDAVKNNKNEILKIN